jgi:hypothetical protein
VSQQFDIDRVQGLNLSLSAGAVAVSWILLSPLFAASLAAGAALEAANFRSLLRSCRVIFQAGVSGSAAAASSFGLRFVLLAATVGFALYLGAHPVGLVIGLSLIVPSVIIAAWMARPEPAPATPVPPPDDPSWDEWNPWLARERERDVEEDQ